MRGPGRFVWALYFHGEFIWFGFAGTVPGPPSVPTWTVATGPLALLPPTR